MAKEIGTVVSVGLHLREIPGSDSRQIIDSLSKGDKLEIIEHRQGKQADWLRVRVLRTLSVGWVAERNYASGERFVSISKEPEPAVRPLPPDWSPPKPKPIEIEEPPPFPWRLVLIALGIIAVIILAVRFL